MKKWIFAGLVILPLCGLYFFHSLNLDAQSGTICNGSPVMAQMMSPITNPASIPTYSGTSTFSAYAGSTNILPTGSLVTVQFLLNDSVISNGTPMNPSQLTTQQWTSQVDLSTKSNNQYQVKARVIVSNGISQSTCDSLPAPIYINNPSGTTNNKSLAIDSSVLNWTGPTNSPIDIVLRVRLISSNAAPEDISNSAIYQWSTNKGIIQPSGKTAKYNSGPSSGGGQILIKVTYSGLNASFNIPVNVTTSTQSTLYPSTQTTGTSAQSGTGSTTIADAENKQFVSANTKANQGDPELEKCLIATFGEQTYNDRIKNNARLSFEDLKKAEQCFVRRNYVIPANLAPIEPNKVKSLPISETELSVKEIKTVKKNNKDVLQITGSAKPEQAVLIYIFSEPLVLTAKADKSGQWSYSLEDPLEAGNHEVYVAVQNDNAQPVRGNAFGFAIASAPKTAENPLGLSLSLKNGSTSTKTSYTMYIAATVLLTLTAGIVGLVVIRKHKKHKPEPTSNPYVQG